MAFDQDLGVSVAFVVMPRRIAQRRQFAVFHREPAIVIARTERGEELAATSRIGSKHHACAFFARNRAYENHLRENFIGMGEKRLKPSLAVIIEARQDND